MTETRELTAEELYQETTFENLSFETTSDLEDLDTVLGQPRAVDAMQFGVGIAARGYNIFALGPAGTGKREVVTHYFQQRAEDASVPPDWVYVNNFDEPHRPRAISLPAGRATVFRQDMETLIEELETALSAAFESEEYQARKQTIASEFQERQSQSFEQLQERAQQRGIALLRTPAGLAFAPMREGEVMAPEEIQNLSEEERKRMEAEVEELQEELQKIVRQVPGWQRGIQERLKELNREIAQFAVGGLIDDLRQKYRDNEKIVQHLDAVQKDVVQHARSVLGGEEEAAANLPPMLRGLAAAQQTGTESVLMRRYRANVVVDNSQATGAPVIHEDNPTYQNLIGRVEHQAQLGALVTDFNLIKPGAMHKANGGYLVLDARKVLVQPYAWEGLKRAIQSREVRIESVGQMLSLITTTSLEPEPIPLDVKVALFGDPELYYLLYYMDPDFPELFKVSADFASQMDRNQENQELYARMIASIVRRENLKPFARSGVARVLEQSARMLGDSDKLSVQMRDIADLLRESNYWASQNGHEAVTANDVERAIEARIYRSDRMRERVQESIQRNILLIDTREKKVGQVNGLSVLQLGNFAFGQPSRITARVWLGKGNLINIEREVEMSGPIHSKGVLILSGFLGERYATDTPLALSASLVFEQSYAGVEGDSASSAELYALLSAISEVPIKQSLAVTGSVNQHGEVQAIGGVNQKIEGFFDVCKAQGLTGDQGVLIPTSNVQHLMLRQDVVNAVREGQFHVYAVDTIDRGIEILTGAPAGEKDEEGNYPPGSINYLVAKRLVQMAERSKRFGEAEKEEEARD
ncbi:MAG: ATP-binding protein [Anaerolineae bacterium]|jgi:lon-related putative ATP-dependent protease|nr:ATP-binding protein [Anaerolineae bacterium]MDX9830273.1 ATP-binding protein [Anaerolineae bacterium]